TDDTVEAVPNVPPADADEYSSLPSSVNATSSFPCASTVDATWSLAVSFSGFETLSVAMTSPWSHTPSFVSCAVMTDGISGRLNDRAGAIWPFGRVWFRLR